jgi:hypothetical protein
VVTIQGMRAMARLQSNRQALEQVAQVALTVFHSKAQSAQAKRTKTQ